MRALQALVASVVLACASMPAHAQIFDESTVLARFNALRETNTDPSKAGYWVQPQNQTSGCAVYMWGGGEPSTSIKWIGACHQGKARGVGVVIAEGGQGKLTALEDYGDSGDIADVVTYRQVSLSPQAKVILKGRVSPGSLVASSTVVASFGQGKTSVTLMQQSCRDGECLLRRVDPQTGTTLYELAGSSSYNASWLDLRADNQPLFQRRWLFIDGAVPIEKYIFDGEVYDIYHDLRSGQSGRMWFSEAANASLALPVEMFSASNNEVIAAVAASDAKFASVHGRLCKGQKNPDIKLLCDPSPLLPNESELAAHRAEINESGRAFYQQLQQKASEANGAYAARVQTQGQQVQGQAMIAEQNRQNRQEALRRGFEALNQAGQAAQQSGQQMMQSFQAPQVHTPSLNQTGVKHCRTIGYITTCI